MLSQLTIKLDIKMLSQLRLFLTSQKCQLGNAEKNSLTKGFIDYVILVVKK